MDQVFSFLDGISHFHLGTCGKTLRGLAQRPQSWAAMQFRAGRAVLPWGRFIRLPLEVDFRSAEWLDRFHELRFLKLYATTMTHVLGTLQAAATLEHLTTVSIRAACLDGQAAIALSGLIHVTDLTLRVRDWSQETLDILATMPLSSLHLRGLPQALPDAGFGSLAHIPGLQSLTLHSTFVPAAPATPPAAGAAAGRSCVAQVLALLGNGSSVLHLDLMGCSDPGVLLEPGVMDHLPRLRSIRLPRRLIGEPLRQTLSGLSSSLTSLHSVHRLRRGRRKGRRPGFANIVLLGVAQLLKTNPDLNVLAFVAANWDGVGTASKAFKAVANAFEAESKDVAASASRTRCFFQRRNNAFNGRVQENGRSSWRHQDCSWSIWRVQKAAHRTASVGLPLAARHRTRNVNHEQDSCAPDDSSTGRHFLFRHVCCLQFNP